jgi:hypothetical protein
MPIWAFLRMRLRRRMTRLSTIFWLTDAVTQLGEKYCCETTLAFAPDKLFDPKGILRRLFCGLLLLTYNNQTQTAFTR